MTIEIGFRMYQEPALRLEQLCTKCNQPLAELPKGVSGNSKEGMIQCSAGCRKDYKSPDREFCDKCNRWYRLDNEE